MGNFFFILPKKTVFVKQTQTASDHHFGGPTLSEKEREL